MERVQKIIAQSGLCSRRKAEELIEDGKVTLNGKLVTIGQSADSDKDEICVDRVPLVKEPKVYYLLNKPRDYITTTDDLYNRKKVTDLLPKKPKIFPVGRLDRYATGFLILTNDGDFANKIMHPRYEIKKTYIAILDKAFDRKQIDLVKKGLIIEKQVVKADIVVLDKNTVAITLHVGINKVVKRIFKQLGYFVKKLHRTHVGNLAIDLPDGEYRSLNFKDKKKIFEKPSITKNTFI